jgi:adenylate kinase
MQMRPRGEWMGLTGSPATGTKTVGKALAGLIHCPLIDLNALAIQSRAVLGEDARGIIVDPRLLASVVRRSAPRHCIFAGHFLPAVFRREELSLVAVLRCAPDELERRYEQRGYQLLKTRENVLAEMLGVCLHEAVERFGRRRVAEFDTTAQTPGVVAKRIRAVSRGQKSGSVGRIDWLSEAIRTGLLFRYSP